MKEFRDITQQSQTLYEDLIAQQETAINALKQDLSTLSANDSYGNLVLLNEQTEQRLQSTITLRTGCMLISASLITVVLSYFLHR